jgi:hypothetical protein
MNVTLRHDLPSDVVSLTRLSSYGLMVEEAMPEQEALHRQSYALKAVPIFKSFYAFYAL